VLWFGFDMAGVSVSFRGGVLTTGSVVLGGARFVADASFELGAFGEAVS
jgi:hypothetical protein